MTLPESVKAAIDADVDAYRAKLEAEARLSVAMHRRVCTDELATSAAVARLVAEFAHERMIVATLMEATNG